MVVWRLISLAKRGGFVAQLGQKKLDRCVLRLLNLLHLRIVIKHVADRKVTPVLLVNLYTLKQMWNILNWFKSSILGGGTLYRLL
jgi:hypothetical protein